VALSVWESAQYFGEGVTPQPLGSAHRMVAPYQAIRCADGYITLGSANERLFQRLCELLGRPEWSRDPAFASDTERVRNRAALIDKIEAITTEQPRAEWLARFEAAGLPCGPINTYAEAFADPQIRARDMVVEIDHPTLGHMRTLGAPVKMSETPPIVNRRAPLLGEHTREVLREVGYNDEDMA
jgi:crotonobetainyl-CoA:carnitine CoA-transferase CaiB-like acyl-CoA transferase